MSSLKTKQFKLKIAQLEKQNHQLRAGFYEIVELAYQVVNQERKNE